MGVTRLVVANWKMNGGTEDLDQIDAMAARLFGRDLTGTVAVAPPFTLLGAARPRKGGRLKLAAQDCHQEADGAHTGDISAPMLAALGVDYVIVGHSERRAGHRETDAAVRAKAEAALAAGLTPIVCIGEPEVARDASEAEAFVLDQLDASRPRTSDDFAIAYEPIWAIGTGRAAMPSDIRAMHRAIRGVLGGPQPILYGGSVKPDNAAEIAQVKDVDGALVGGASLRAADFLPIVEAFLAPQAAVTEV